MNILSVNKKQALLVYYLVLILVSFFLMKPYVAIPTYLRILMLIFIFIPVIFNLDFFPFVFLVFNGISLNSFAPILPTNPIFIISIIITAFIIYKKSSIMVVKYLCFYLYFFICSAIYLDVSQQFLIWIPLAILVIDMVKTTRDVLYLYYSFLIISLFLSLLFIYHVDDFLVQYGSMSEGLERSGWVNANEFGSVIAAGGVLASANLSYLPINKKSSFTLILRIIVIFLSFYVLVLNASRGAFIAFISTSVLFFLTTKTKLYVKVLITTAAVFIVFWMFQNNIFELLSYRMQDETFDSGGDRTRIWQVKLTLFFQESSPFQFLFGIGRTACVRLAEYISTHNDFITAIIGFGIVGFCLISYILIIYPIRIAIKSNNKGVIILLLYLLLECSVAEPFFRGNIIVIMFYFFYIKYITICKSESIY